MHVWTYRRSEDVRFLLRLNIGKKKFAACLLYNLGIAVFSEGLCHLRAGIQYNPQVFAVVNSFTFCPPSVSNGMTVLFALLVLRF